MIVVGVVAGTTLVAVVFVNVPGAGAGALVAGEAVAAVVNPVAADLSFLNEDLNDLISYRR